MTDNQPDLKQPISWQAPEAAAIERGTVWYVLFGVVTVALIAISIFLIKSWTFAILVVVMAVAVVLLSTKPPRVINYSISPKGVYIADKLHSFSEFRAFSVNLELSQPSIILLPVKRFAPSTIIYFSEDKGEIIVDMLGARLPMQEHKPDVLEKLIHLIKL